MTKTNPKKNIIVELDSFDIKNTKQWLASSRFYDHFNIYVLTTERKHNVFKNGLDSNENLHIITYEDIFNYTAEVEIDLQTYHDFVKFCFNDHISARMIDREGYFPKYGRGVQNAFSYYTFKSYSILLFLIHKKIDFVYFRLTPHKFKEWILAKTADFLKIDIYITELFVFPWLHTIKKGYRKNRDLIFEHYENESKDAYRTHIKNYIDIISGDYESAIPSYEKSRMGNGLLKFYNPFRDVKEILKRPHRYYNKTRNFFFYKNNSKHIDVKNTNYVVFFLHYQPETTTLPEGFDFVDQFYAVHLFSRILPEGYKLVVKEHPSMFTYQSEHKFRNIYNYTSLLALKNVEFCSINQNSFELVDNSLAVATITGTVAVEAYIRKKPVIIFGKNNLNLNSVYTFENVKGLEHFLRKITKEDISSQNGVDELVDLCYGVSMSGFTETAIEKKDYYLRREFEEIAHYKLLSRLLNSKLERTEPVNKTI